MELIQGSGINALRRLQRALHYMLIETFIVSLFITSDNSNRVLSLPNLNVQEESEGLSLFHSARAALLE